MSSAIILKQFFKAPRSIGAVCPSSPKLCRKIATGVGLERARVVVELGPGTGAITPIILDMKHPECLFFAVELNDEIITVFRKRFPSVKVYQDCASNLPKMLKKEGVGKADLIISGLPWTTFPVKLQEKILKSIDASLAPGGVFTTFAYLQGLLLPSSGNFKKLLRHHFAKVERSQVVWTNIPPAFVYRCTKAR
jgi:phospholipid N-methyltransferase